ncbi:unnamed protein product [Ixodes persulcatus]
MIRVHAQKTKNSPLFPLYCKMGEAQDLPLYNVITVNIYSNKENSGLVPHFLACSSTLQLYRKIQKCSRTSLMCLSGDGGTMHSLGSPNDGQCFLWTRKQLLQDSNLFRTDLPGYGGLNTFTQIEADFYSGAVKG